MKPFAVTYTIKGRTITERGLTAEGVTNLMNAVLRAKGTGAAVEQAR